MFKIVILAAALGSPQQFNLNCTGKTERLGGASKPFNSVFRVDLSAMRYCRDECKTIAKISMVNENYLEFGQIGDAEIGYILSLYYRWLSKYEKKVLVDGEHTKTIATCKLAPFSDFPKRR